MSAMCMCQFSIQVYISAVDASEFHFFTDGTVRMEASVSVLFVVLCVLVMMSCR